MVRTLVPHKVDQHVFGFTMFPVCERWAEFSSIQWHPQYCSDPDSHSVIINGSPCTPWTDDTVEQH